MINLLGRETPCKRHKLVLSLAVTLQYWKRNHVKRTFASRLSTQRMCDAAVFSACFFRETCTENQMAHAIGQLCLAIRALKSHLKSSHIAEKRNNLNMALKNPLPCLNETVIDNWRYSIVRGIDWCPIISPKQCLLCHTGTLLWGSASIAS